VLFVVGGEEPLRGADPPGLGDELGYLAGVNLAEADEDPWVAVVVGRNEELARLGLEQLVASIKRSAQRTNKVPGSSCTRMNRLLRTRNEGRRL
jgi:hypothetical protein